MLKQIKQSERLSLTYSVPGLQRLARHCAKNLGFPQFKASRNFIARFAKRHNYKWSTITTDRQQSIESFLQCWNVWIHSFRKYIGTLGLVTPYGYITSRNIWNIDEFGIEPISSSTKLKRMVGKGANMINGKELMCVPSTSKRAATITGIVPKSGFDPQGSFVIYILFIIMYIFIFAIDVQ